MSDNGPALYAIRLERAREPGLPDGSSRDGYDFVAPLDPEGRLDSADWSRVRGDCLVTRFRHDARLLQGRLARKGGGAWFFDYDRDDDRDDETGFRFADEVFTIGEYVSIKEQDGLHTYRVVSVEPV